MWRFYRTLALRLREWYPKWPFLQLVQSTAKVKVMAVKEETSNSHIANDWPMLQLKRIFTLRGQLPWLWLWRNILDCEILCFERAVKEAIWVRVITFRTFGTAPIQPLSRRMTSSSTYDDVSYLKLKVDHQNPAEWCGLHHKINSLVC